MPRKSVPEFKPLLYTTTMRNPARLKFMLYILNMYEGRILNDELATEICGEAIRYGLYRPMKKSPSVKEKWSTTKSPDFAEYILSDIEVKWMLEANPQKHGEAGFAYGWPSRFATVFDFMKELGLSYFWPGEPIIISSLGKHLLNSFEIEKSESDGLVNCKTTHPEYEQQVFLHALAKSQRKNPFVRVLNDNIPLILLLETIRKLNSDRQQNGCGISRKELPLLIFWKDNNADALYRRIVDLRKKNRYDPSEETVIDICINEIMGGNFKEFDPKSIMVDYPDEFIRKMRMTGLFSLRGAGRFLDINKNENETVNYILANYSHYKHYADEREYFDYMAELDTNLIQISTKPTTVSNSEKFLDEWIEVYTWNIIKKELSNLSSHKNSSDNVLKLLAAPSRLEFLTALAIKSRMPNVRVVPNYCCDDTGLPTSTASGNKGDIECYEQQNGILVEVTMSTGRTQTIMEIWPIDRHLEEFQREINAQCIFIAPSIFHDSLQQIHFVSYQSNGKRMIRPYTIGEFVNYLENSQSLYSKYSKHNTKTFTDYEDRPLPTAAEGI